MSRPSKMNPAHPITLCKSICIEVKHTSIKGQDISSVLKFAKLFTSTEQNAWNTRGSVSLSFAGYCSDPRELWEISEVRAYVKKLTTEWPTWMFFLDGSLCSLVTCFMCLCEMARTDDPNKHRVVSLPREVLTQGFEGIQKICTKYKFGEDMCSEIWNQVATSLGVPIDDLYGGASETATSGSAA